MRLSLASKEFSMSNVINYFNENNIKKIYYFHIDHFEPTSLDNQQVVKDRVIDEFLADMNKYNHSKKISLFYRPTFTVRINEDEVDGSFAADGDFVSFLWDENTNKSMEILSRIDGASEFGFGLHVHHEHFAECDSMSNDVKMLFLRNDNSYAMDRARFRLYLEQSKEFMTKSLGVKTAERRQFAERGWLFVHGKWALNCSDLRVCRMEDEIILLKSHGCCGDFSFPAGRRHCDPHMKTPFTIRPFRGFRTYDYMPSVAKPVCLNSNVMTKDRFFIWNSKLEHPSSSLDVKPGHDGRLDDYEGYLNRLLDGSVRVGDSLFVKTYSHSMEGRLGAPSANPYPLAHPNVLKMFDSLEASCTKNNVELNYVTAKEVYDIFKKIDDGSLAC